MQFQKGVPGLRKWHPKLARILRVYPTFVTHQFLSQHLRGSLRWSYGRCNITRAAKVNGQCIMVCLSWELTDRSKSLVDFSASGSDHGILQFWFNAWKLREEQPAVSSAPQAAYVCHECSGISFNSAHAPTSHFIRRWIMEAMNCRTSVSAFSLIWDFCTIPLIFLQNLSNPFWAKLLLTPVNSNILDPTSNEISMALNFVAATSKERTH